MIALSALSMYVIFTIFNSAFFRIFVALHSVYYVCFLFYLFIFFLLSMHITKCYMQKTNMQPNGFALNGV